MDVWESRSKRELEGRIKETDTTQKWIILPQEWNFLKLKTMSSIHLFIYKAQSTYQMNIYTEILLPPQPKPRWL
jgi:hypothetical protein